MEAYEKLLDETEANIQLIPNDSEYRAALITELRELRQEFENRIDSDVLIEAKIREFNRRVIDYINGRIKNPIVHEEVTVPRIELDFDSDIQETGERLVQKAKEETAIEILKAQLLRIGEEENVDNIRCFVELIQEKYEEIYKYSQDLEQTIESIRFKIMLKYLQESRFEEAQEYAKTFGTDMRIYIVNKFKDKIDTLIKEGRLEEAEKLNAYIYDDSMQENDIQLWYLIAKIELEEFNIPDKRAQKSNLPAVLDKKSFWTKYKEKREQKKRDKEESKENNVKIFRIRFDPNNKENGINLNDLKKLNRYKKKSSTNKKLCGFKVILEEGITEIPGRVFGNSRIIDITVPSTLKRIAESAFAGSCLEKIDLSRTKVTEIPTRCFGLCEHLVEIKLPNNLERIGESAFCGSGLKKIDLSQTKVTELLDNTFSNCRGVIEEIVLPNGLEYIGNSVFYGSLIKRLDMSNTRITTISKKWFAGCRGEYIRFPKTVKELDWCSRESGYYSKITIDDTSLDFNVIDLSLTEITYIPKDFFRNNMTVFKVIVPNNLERIDCGAFANSTIQTIDLSATKVRCIPRDAFNGCRHIERVIVPPTLEEIGKRAFEGSSIEILDLSSVEQYVSIKEHAFRNCDRWQHVIRARQRVHRNVDTNINESLISQNDDDGEIED